MPHRIKELIIDPLLLLALLFVGSGLAGWAKLIWEGKTPERRKLIAGSVLSGVAGLLMALLLWSRLIDHDPALLAMVSLLAGVGGVTVIDLLLAILVQRLKNLGTKEEPK